MRTLSKNNNRTMILGARFRPVTGASLKQRSALATGFAKGRSTRDGRSGGNLGAGSAFLVFGVCLQDEVPDALVGRGVGDRTEQRERALFAVDGVLTCGERHVASGSASAVPDPESNELETLERSTGEVQLGVCEFSNRAPCVSFG